MNVFIATCASAKIGRFLPAVIAAWVATASAAGADEQAPRQIIRTLTGVASVGSTSLLVPFGGAVTQPFVVPQGYALVLTDVVVSPQSFPPTGDFTWLVTSQPSPVTTAYLLVTSSAAEPSSFQVHLTTGMSFPAGSGVGVTLGNGGSSLNVSAFGYLAPKASAR